MLLAAHEASLECISYLFLFFSLFLCVLGSSLSLSLSLSLSFSLSEARSQQKIRCLDIFLYFVPLFSGVDAV